MSVILACKTHPKYKAEKPPRSCSACWHLYYASRAIGIKQLVLLTLKNSRPTTRKDHK